MLFSCLIWLSEFLFLFFFCCWFWCWWCCCCYCCCGSLECRTERNLCSLGKEGGIQTWQTLAASSQTRNWITYQSTRTTQKVTFSNINFKHKNQITKKKVNKSWQEHWTRNQWLYSSFSLRLYERNLWQLLSTFNEIQQITIHNMTFTPREVWNASLTLLSLALIETLIIFIFSMLWNWSKLQ